MNFKRFPICLFCSMHIHSNIIFYFILCSNSTIYWSKQNKQKVIILPTQISAPFKVLSVLNFMLTRYVGKQRLQFISTCILLFFPWETFISRILSVFGGNSNHGGVARILIEIIVFSPFVVFLYTNNVIIRKLHIAELWSKIENLS